MRVSRLVVAAGCGVVALSGYAEDEPYVEPELTEEDRGHWAYRPVRSNIEGDIDSLALEKLRELGINDFAPRADAVALLRRLHFHLVGLPPTPEEVAEFESDMIAAVASDTETRGLGDAEKPNASATEIPVSPRSPIPASSPRASSTSPKEKVIASAIDDLLSRSQYGERWAQHWLDVARFAETDGFEHDKVRKEAWRYRDWVIDALNRDLPYDEFVGMQIAGDELSPGDEGGRLATGFLFSGPDMPDINLETERRHVVLNEISSAVGSAFLGLTMGCAQCHDHKDDAISQADFYRLRAFFDNAALPKKNQSLPHVFAESGGVVAEGCESVLRIRGDFRRAGEELQPAFLRVVNRVGKRPDIAPRNHSTGRRAALAEWLIDPANPLVSRVIVNRVWQHHFGRGLVATPNDFGVLGDRPSHPQLLDWLATDFVENGWSLKRLHRQILMSRVWQQASRRMPADQEWDKRLGLDADGRMLSRRMRIRLDGETIRDSMLQISGTLNAKAGGPGFLPPLPAEVSVTLLKNQWPVTEDESEHFRRSVYLFARRNLRYPMFEVFDRPAANFSCARRHVSTTATQSLMLMNSEFSAERARETVERLVGNGPAEGAGTVEKAVDRAFVAILGRTATESEVLEAKAFVAAESMADFVLALFNTNEFVFLD